MKAFKKISVLILSLILLFALCVTAYAHEIPTFSESGKILSVAHGGNTMLYPRNSLAAIQSAFEKGADFVSVNVKRTADNKFVLSDSDDLGDVSLEGTGMTVSLLPASQVTLIHLNNKSGNLSDHPITDLESAVKVAVAYDKSIIIDGAWEDRELIYNFISDINAADNAVIRTDASRNEVKEFIEITGSNCRVMGQYHGNILFNARSYITTLSKSGCKAVFLGTKNSFGTVFRKGVLSAFSITGYSARAAINTYEPYQSGGRPDCEMTWDDVIDRGYSVIETDRIDDLVEYISRLDGERAALGSLVAQAKSVEPAFLTAQSYKNLKLEIEKSTYALTTISSYKTLSAAESALNYALENKVLSETVETDSQGVLNITVGKIIAVVLVTAALTAVQIFFYYKRADKKLPKCLEKLLRK